MCIQDFYQVFTAGKQDRGLFQALHNLSLVEDPKSVLNADPMAPAGEWAVWPPMEANAVFLTA